MKQFYYRILSGFLPVILIASIFVNVNAQEMQTQKYCAPKNTLYTGVNIGTIEQNNLDLKNKSSELQAIDFYIMDSLANLYSYFYLMTNRSFVYDRTTENYITIKRGAFPQTAQSTDKTYNLFLKMSEDKGVTWNEPIIVYDKDAIGYYEARYPTLYGFSMNGVQNVALSFPVIDYNLSSGDGVWYGFVSAMWTPDITDPALIPMNASLDLSSGGNLYKWSTDSRILAGTQVDDPSKYFYLAAGELTPDDDANLVNASSFGLRYSEKVDDEVTATIPEAWSGLKFTAPTTPGGRFNQIVDFRQANDGAMYLGVYGNFINNVPSDPNPNRVGVSRSTDYGVTWEEFNILPLETITNYVNSQGYTGGSFAMGSFQFLEPPSNFYSCKAFVVFDNNEYSFFLWGFLYDSGNTLVEAQLIEVYYDNSSWGIRKISSLTTSLFIYKDVYLNGHQGEVNYRLFGSEFEIQGASTKDGSILLCKWMDWVGVDVNRTTDIFVATRSKNSNKWGEPQNITNSLEIDRCVLIPDYIHNDFTDIPILKLESISGAQDSTVIPQYLKVGFFNPVVSVDENQYDNSQLSLEVLPNPVSDFARIKVYYEGKPVQAEVSVYDLLGNKVESIELPNLSYGTSFHDLKTTGMNSGVYLCTISLGDKKITKIMNVIK